MIKPKKSVLEMQPYKPPVEGRDDYIRLDFNENLVGATPKLKRIKISPDYISIYPEYTKLIRGLSKYFRLPAECILPTNGADEGIKVVVDTYVENGDEVILLNPSFPMFKVYAQIAGARIKSILYNDDFSFPSKKVFSAITKSTRLVIIANPNNPTGTLAKKADVEKILKKAKNSAVLIDEAYSDFSGVSCIDLLGKYNNLIIVKSFSKVFGLAGLRFGVLLSNKKNISYMKNVRSPYSVNSVAVKLGLIALSDKKHAMKYVDGIKKNKKILAAFLRKKGIYAYEGHANFLLAKFKDPKKVYAFLKKKGILIRRISIKDYVRITIGTKGQTNCLIRCLGDYDE